MAPAQTSSVAHLAVQSGNGQVACICITATLQAFQPISVKATDVNGNPVAGATVNWSQITNPPQNGGVVFVNFGNTTSITNSNGIAINTISTVILNNFTSSAVPYLVATIQASSNNQTATFTETQSLVTQQGASVIQGNIPTFNGQTLDQAGLSGNVGTTLSTPIQVRVAGLDIASNGVPSVAIRLVNAQTSPTLSCAPSGGSADPGTVLTDAVGNASCFPVFNGSGTGVFYVTIGGVPSNDITSAVDLVQFGPYTFTSIPGAPTSIQIVSGSNQFGSVGQLLNLLIAKVVDSGGNPVQGQPVVWTVTPLGAVSLTLTPNFNQTDNNGLTSATASLFSPAAAGAQIKVALQNNPGISATFQVGLTSAITGLTKISGDGQSAPAGTNFANRLVVQVNSAAGPVRGYPVTFTANGPVSLVGVNNNTVGTDNNGQAIVTVQAGNTSGTGTVTAAVGALTQIFTLSVTGSTTPPPSSLTMVSGNSQSVAVNGTFAPLVVQVNSTAGPVAGSIVSFSSNGPVSLSTAAATTNANGQAQVTVQAGATAGAATVTASIAGLTQTFNLTVTSQSGLTINSSNFLNAASRQVGSLSPCSLAILSAPGLTPDGVSDFSLAPIFGRLPLSVHNLSIAIGGKVAPIVSVAMGSTNPEVTFQVPCEVTPGSSVPVVVIVGTASASTTIAVQTVSPGIFETTMSDGVKRAVVVRDDGTFADVGTAFPNPARRGERVRIYVTGLAPTIPTVGTNSIQDPNADLFGVNAVVAGAIQISLGGSGGVQVISARQAPDLIGVYEVQFLVPAGAPTGNDVPITVGIVPTGSGAAAVQSAASKIPIQ
jgi:uncharacterized protein (TIGR03437 family)